MQSFEFLVNIKKSLYFFGKYNHRVRLIAIHIKTEWQQKLNLKSYYTLTMVSAHLHEE